MKHCCTSMEQVVAAEGTRLRFDPIYEEYSVRVLEGHEFGVFFCPFCGAKAPDSKRASFFTSVTTEEAARVLARVAECTSRTAIEGVLGEPDQIFRKTEYFDPIRRQKLSFPDTYLYKQLSDTAQLRVTFDDAGTIEKKLTEPQCTRKK